MTKEEAKVKFAQLLKSQLYIPDPEPEPVKEYVLSKFEKELKEMKERRNKKRRKR